MEENKVIWHKKYRKYIVIGLLLVLLMAIFGFGGKRLYKYHKDLLEVQIKRYDSLELASKKRVDSISSLIDNYQFVADEMRFENDELRIRNNNLYYALKKQAQSLRVVDTSFRINALRISESSNRFYQRNDTIR